MPRREPSDPSAALARVQAGFTGGVTGILEALKQRQEGGQRLRELLLQGRINREAEETKPETQILRKLMGLAPQLQPTPQPGGSGFTMQERDVGIPGMVEEAARTRNEPVQQQIDALLTMIGKKPQKSFEQIMAEEFGKSKARQEGQLSAIDMEGVGGEPSVAGQGTPSGQSSIDRVLAKLPRGASLRMGPLTLTNPALTEEERQRGAMSGSGLDFLKSVRQRLHVKGTSVGRPDLLAYSRSILPETWQEAVQSPESRQLYTDLDSAFGNLALLLTGRQGDIQRLRQLQQVYYFGGFSRNKPGVIANRLQAMERLFGMFDANASIGQIHGQIDRMAQEAQQDQVSASPQQREAYNAARARGLSPEAARQAAGL